MVRIDPEIVPKSPNFCLEGSTVKTDTEWYIICDKSEEMTHKESSYAEKSSR